MEVRVHHHSSSIIANFYLENSTFALFLLSNSFQPDWQRIVSEIENEINDDSVIFISLSLQQELFMQLATWDCFMHQCVFSRKIQCFIKSEPNLM